MNAIRVVHSRGRASKVLGADSTPIPECSRYLEQLSIRGVSPHTVEAYAHDLALIYRWLHARGLELRALTADNVHQFIAWERGRASAPRSINRRLHTLQLYYRHVLGRALPGGTELRSGWRHRQRDYELGLQTMPERAHRKLRVKVDSKVVEPLTVAQVRELLGSMRRYRDIAIVYLMLLCGLRSIEVIRILSTDVNFVDRQLRVRGKGDKERVVPLPPIVMGLLQRYSRIERPPHCPSGHLFVVLQGRRRGEGMTRAGLRRIFRSRRVNPSLARANPHKLRHTFGADMARAGVRLPILQRMMGHAQPETTLQYVNLAAADIAEEFERVIAKLEERYACADEDATP